MRSNMTSKSIPLSEAPNFMEFKLLPLLRSWSCTCVDYVGTVIYLCSLPVTRLRPTERHTYTCACNHTHILGKIRIKKKK